MRLSTLGEVVITATPKHDNPELFDVSIICQHKQDAMTMETQRYETVDQFGRRITSALRAMVNAADRAKPVTEQAKEQAQELSYEEQKKLGEQKRKGAA